MNTNYIELAKGLGSVASDASRHFERIEKFRVSIEERYRTLGSDLTKYHNGLDKGLEEHGRLMNERCEALGRDLAEMELNVCEQLERLKSSFATVRLLISLRTV